MYSISLLILLKDYPQNYQHFLQHTNHMTEEKINIKQMLPKMLF